MNRLLPGAVVLLLFFANAVSAAPLELDTLRQQYEKVVAERVTAVYEAGKSDLDTGFAAALDKAIAQSKAAGDLPAVLILQGDRKLLTEGQALPDDDDTTPESLKKLRAIYREQLAKLSGESDANTAKLDGPFLEQLKNLEVKLTQADRVEDAAKVMEFRMALKTNPPAAVAGKMESIAPAIGAAGKGGDSGFTFTQGKLFAVGKMQGDKIIDLTAAEGISDFVDVTGGVSSWAGLRQDGTAVGWHAKSGAFSMPGIRQLVSAQQHFSGHLFGITITGNLVNLVTGEIIIATGNVKDAAIQQNHSIALLDDGTVKLWGLLHEGPVADIQPFPKVAEEDLRDGVAIGATRYRAYMVNVRGKITAWGSGGQTISEFPEELRKVTRITGTGFGVFFETRERDLHLMTVFSDSKVEPIAGTPGLIRSGDESVISYSRPRWNLVYSPDRIRQELNGELAALDNLNGEDLPFFYQKAMGGKLTASYLLWLSADEPAAAE